MEKYNPKKIEPKWQRIWQEQGLYQTKDASKKSKFYVLDMFPYPSGAGLHVGHLKGYIATDVVARMKMMQGYNVLHPMGFDAFGLPAENYALKHKVHPKIAVEKNIKRYKDQLKKVGFTYDWSREIKTTDPEYYKWTQWIFLQMFKKGLVYESFEPVNWCPKCQTVLANEDLDQGKCERCGTLVERKPMRQWVLKMTAYAERLLKDLDLLDWEDSIIEQQRNWIGKSEGAEIKFKIIIANISSLSLRAQRSNLTKDEIASSLRAPRNDIVEVFTTRLDTIFGCTYLVVAPEHEIVASLVKPQIPMPNAQSSAKSQIPKDKIQNLEEIKRYIEKSKRKSDLERTDLAKEKTGVEIKGIKAINPFNGEQVPIFVADYVLPHYATGAIMAVPSHDARDFAFAKRYGLPMRQVILPRSSKFQTSKSDGKSNAKFQIPNKLKEAFEEDGVLINSGKFSGLTSEKAREEMLKYAEKQGFGKKAVYYKMHDWVFSRQRYWGEPIPLIFCENCKKLAGNPKPETRNPKLKEKFNKGELLNPGWIAVPEKDLPLKLPEVKHYEPTGTGESPLANIKKWVNTKCPKCGGPARRETNTMPQWAGSCWYYLRYIDPKNKKTLVSSKKEKYWMPVDLYVGGAEHATRHLLYARFWHKFLQDIGIVSGKEPFKKLKYVGLILAGDGRKMSKRWGNVINPDEVIEKFGADSLRLYEMFMGPFSQPIAWNMKGVVGMRRFLEKVWNLNLKVRDKSVIANEVKQSRDIASSLSAPRNDILKRLVHQTIKKVTEDIESFKFNTAISALMILANELEKEKTISLTHYSLFLILLSPFAPHLAEEIWHQLGNKKSIFQEPWPQYDKKLVKEEKISLVIQINGKVRDRVEVEADISEEEAKKLTLKREKVKKWIKGKTIRKVIFVKGRLVNIVI